MLQEAPSNRAKWLRDSTDRRLTDRVNRVVRDAETVEGLLAALDLIIDKEATPDVVSAGAMVLQPSEARRRSGSHYTPRELTEPIVRDTLAPILDRLRGERGKSPRHEQILDLKVCDPAMGSGAFLVEVCRQLGDALVDSWRAHEVPLNIPADENEIIFARRQVAQRCLYGVDRNPAAVDLAKLSLWLVTLAKDHPLTFLDHALRHGDSLVGLTRRQIEGFHWMEGKLQAGIETGETSKRLRAVAELRQRIRQADEKVPDRELHDLWDAARYEAGQVALFGDLVLAAFFEGKRAKEREELRRRYAVEVLNEVAHRYRSWLEDLRDDEPPLVPFHWELEFPEVFDRDNSGFDAIVGNPPFAGKNTVAAANVPRYPDWLKQMHAESHGNADLVAHFFRRAFDLVRSGGGFGLIATNTIAQGDTRSTGLRWICENGGEIYRAHRRLKWPGLAAVVVSVLHVWKGRFDGVKQLDGRVVDKITAFLFHRGGNTDPARLKANAGKSFQGSIVLGMGFTFDDTDKKGVATPTTEMHRLIEENPRNQEVIFPYIGGEEVNKSPTHRHHRYVINFKEMDEATCRSNWPDLMNIVEAKVKSERAKLTKNSIGRKRAEYWWQYGSLAKEMYAAIARCERVIVVSRVGNQGAFAFLPTNVVYADSTIVFPVVTFAAFCALQSRPHEIWARFLGSSMKDDLRYTPSDCFETYPFPNGWETHSELEAAGRVYCEFRAALMVEHNEGLTKTYNRFHDRDENDPQINRLRELHTGMDRVVLDAYGWHDIPTDCDFILDYEIDEEKSGRRRKPYRYRWPDDMRDQVLARLLELNAEHANE